MFTVILLSRRAREAFEASGAGVLFEPFESNGSAASEGIAFCDWNPSRRAKSLEEATPGLQQLIVGKREWRALIVDVQTEESSGEPTRPDNPFDFVDNEGRHGLHLRESPHALVRLTHWLLGYPDMGAKNFVPYISYVDGETGESRRVRIADLVEGTDLAPTVPNALQRLRTDPRHRTEQRQVQVQYDEVEYTEAERAAHAALEANYRLHGDRPTEVVCISTRPPRVVRPKEALREDWRLDRARRQSQFTERNDYPAATRFAVYELLQPDHTNYQQDELRFWLTVLSLAANTLPPSSFQAERLYELGLRLDEGRLAETLNDHLSSLEAARAQVERQLRRSARPPELRIEELVELQTITMAFDRLDGGDLAVPLEGFGLASDRPRREIEVWRSEFGGLQRRSELFTKQPKRVLAKAVYETHLRAQSYSAEEFELSEFEREELEDELRTRLPALTQPATTDILDRARLRRMLAAHDAEVSAMIGVRLDARTIVIAAAVALAAWLAGSIPYLVQAGTHGIAAFGGSLLVVVGSLLVIAAAGTIALLVQRWRLIARLRRVNQDLRRFVTQVYEGAATFADYLSQVATYLHANSRLLGATRKGDSDRHRLHSLRALGRAIGEAMQREKNILRTLDLPVEFQRDLGEREPIDLTDERAIRRLFQLPVGTGVAAFNDAGTTVAAVYDFVERLDVERVPVFDLAEEPATEPGRAADPTAEAE